MGILRNCRGFHENRIIQLKKFGIYLGEWKNLFKRKNEWTTCKLTKEEAARANEFYLANYGKKIPLHWHRLYKSYTGRFDEKYLPEILFSTELEEKLNPFSVAYHLENKAFIPQQLFGHLDRSLQVKVPEMYAVNCRGTFWGQNGKILSYDELIKILFNAGEVIIKPTVDTLGGNNVRLLRLEQGKDQDSDDTIENILSTYKQDYIVQKRVINHPSIAKLYSESINTLRIMTFVCNDEIHVSPLSMRIGMSGRVVDNGGIFIGVKQSGELYQKGFGKYNRIEYLEHPDTHIAFDGYHIEGVSERIETAKRLHAMIPQLKMLSWDMAYDEDNNVVVIEVNTTGQSVWFPQMVTGESVFGEYTADMLKLIKKGC